MGIKVRSQMKDVNQILKERGMDRGGRANQYFTKQFAKEMNNYVPYSTGRLKDDSVQIKDTCIIYEAEYAKIQYFRNELGGTKNRTGLRGKFWDKRCWVDKGNIILKRLAKFILSRGRSE